MHRNAFRKECRLLLTGTIILNLVAFCISLPFLGWSLPFPLGLLVGSLVAFGNLYLLSHSLSPMQQPALLQGAVVRKRYVRFYLLRMAILGAVFVLALKVAWLSPIAVVLPSLYPRVIYTLSALIPHSQNKQ